MENYRVSTDATINALNVVKQLVSDQSQLTDYMLSGDKDTYREAFSHVMNDHSLPKFYEMTDEDISKYSKEFSEEIVKEFDVLILFGKEELKKLDGISKFIDQQLEFQQKLKVTGLSRIIPLRSL